LPTRALAELLNRTLVVVAHPDDEAIGAGALMQRINESMLVFCTDGGPKDSYFWHQYGSREEYVRVRRKEAEAAAGIAGVKRLEFFPFIDQELYLNLHDALEKLERSVQTFQPQSILTLAYEGGHPDHDSCAFLSCRIGARHRLPVWELPLYHRGKDGPAEQKFVHPGNNITEIEITPTELHRKKEMVSAYVSQSGLLQAFDLSLELFRPQVQYDFLRPPVAEVINYEAWQWPMKALQVCEAFAAVQEIQSR
jgi:N-acetylglucosamine malate deacetylase 2